MAWPPPPGRATRPGPDLGLLERGSAWNGIDQTNIGLVSGAYWFGSTVPSPTRPLFSELGHHPAAPLTCTTVTGRPPPTGAPPTVLRLGESRHSQKVHNPAYRRSCLTTILSCTRQLRAWRIRADHSAFEGKYQNIRGLLLEPEVLKPGWCQSRSNAPKPNPASESRGAYAGHCQRQPDLKYDLKTRRPRKCGTAWEPWR
jgi:hypothetical protein